MAFPTNLVEGTPVFSYMEGLRIIREQKITKVLSNDSFFVDGFIKSITLHNDRSLAHAYRYESNFYFFATLDEAREAAKAEIEAKLAELEKYSKELRNELETFNLLLNRKLDV